MGATIAREYRERQPNQRLEQPRADGAAAEGAVLHALDEHADALRQHHAEADMDDDAAVKPQSSDSRCWAACRSLNGADATTTLTISQSVPEHFVLSLVWHVVDDTLIAQQGQPEDEGPDQDYARVDFWERVITGVVGEAARTAPAHNAWDPLSQLDLHPDDAQHTEAHPLILHCRNVVTTPEHDHSLEDVSIDAAILEPSGSFVLRRPTCGLQPSSPSRSPRFHAPDQLVPSVFPLHLSRSLR